MATPRNVEEINAVKQLIEQQIACASDEREVSRYVLLACRGRR